MRHCSSGRLAFLVPAVLTFCFACASGCGPAPAPPPAPPRPSDEAVAALPAATPVSEAAPPPNLADLLGVRDERKSRLQPRSRAILVTELSGLERLMEGSPQNGSPKPTLARRLAETYVELEAAALRDYTSALAAGDQNQAKRADQVVKAARKKAIDNYSSLLNESPPYGQLDEVLYDLALEYERASDLRNARSTYYDLVKKRPESKYIPNAYLAFGEMFFDEAQHDASKLDLAVQAYTEVLKYPAPQNKVYGYAWFKLGLTFRAKGETDKSANAFKKAIAFTESFPQAPGASRLAEAARKEEGARVAHQTEATQPVAVARPQPAAVVPPSSKAPAAGGPTVGTTTAPPALAPAPPAAAPAPSPAFDAVAATPQPASLALIVGIESYRSLPTPTGARTDAARIETLMKRTFGITPERVKVLTDARATRSDILSGLEWLKSNAKAGSRVYFYFSGHGSPEPSSGAAYLLPYESDQDNLLQSGIKLDDVAAALAHTKAREAVAIIDSCFSGTGERSVLAPGTRALTRTKESSAPSQVLLLTASRASETSGPSAEKIGLFTKFITEGLGRGSADADGDGQITAQELYDWVTPRVTREALAQHRNQTPQITVGSGLAGASQVVLGYGYR